MGVGGIEMRSEVSTEPAERSVPRVRRGPFGLPAIPVGRLLGIPIAVDASWFVIFALATIALAGQLGEIHPDTHPVAPWIGAVGLALAFFACIVLHELGHSAAALRLGIPVRSITLFLFGGVARMDRNPSTPAGTLLVGLAGPAVSVVIGGLVGGAAAAFAGDAPATALVHQCLLWLATVNLVLAGFNLLPGTPLDGGHVVRAAVWAWTGSEERGASAADRGGAAVATMLVAIGLVSAAFLRDAGGLWIAVLGWFLGRSARGSAQVRLLEHRLERVLVADALDPRPEVVEPATRVGELLETRVLAAGAWRFCVVQGERLVGFVTLRELRRVPLHERASTRVEAVMIPRASVSTVEPSDSLWKALGRMDDQDVHQLPVVDGDRLVGVIRRDRVLAAVRANLEELENELFHDARLRGRGGEESPRDPVSIDTGLA